MRCLCEYTLCQSLSFAERSALNGIRNAFARVRSVSLLPAQSMKTAISIDKPSGKSYNKRKTLVFRRFLQIGTLLVVDRA